MVTAVTSTDTSAAAQAMKKETGLNKDDFLKLFVTQLKNQDPLNPMDSTQYVSQLAQLTQVEQAYNTNSNLQNILAALNGGTGLSAVSMVGKYVVAPGSSFSLASGDQPVLNYRTTDQASSVVVKISNSAGAVVRTITQGATAAGDHTVSWDGKDDSGNNVAAGNYSFSATGYDSTGSASSATPLMQGRVTGLKMDSSSPTLTVNGFDVPLSSVLTVRESLT
jgi:flagellar basal-body rod modification protein FlgD